jgi:hypothetical protein
MRVCEFTCVCEWCTCTMRFINSNVVRSGAADCSWATVPDCAVAIALDPSSGALFVVNRRLWSGTNAVCRVPPGGGVYDPRA